MIVISNITRKEYIVIKNSSEEWKYSYICNTLWHNAKTIWTSSIPKDKSFKDVTPKNKNKPI